MISLQVDVGGVLQNLDLAIDSLNDLGPIFRKFIPVKRRNVDKVFKEGKGWPPLDEDTLANRQSRAEAVAAKIRAGVQSSLASKLSGERARIQRRLKSREQTGDTSERGQKLLASAQRSLARKDLQRTEFARITSGGDRSAMAKGTQKVVARLERREQRAEQKIAAFEGGEPLGQIANSIVYEVQGKLLTVRSAIGWAGVHNDGGTAGNRARIPQRKFLEWTQEDLQEFSRIAAEYVAQKANGQKK